MKTKRQPIIGPYKEAVLYEIQDGKRVEIRRMKFRLSSTEAALLREKKALNKKLLSAKTALDALKPFLVTWKDQPECATALRIMEGMK